MGRANYPVDPLFHSMDDEFMILGTQNTYTQTHMHAHTVNFMHCATNIHHGRRRGCAPIGSPARVNNLNRQVGAHTEKRILPFVQALPTTQRLKTYLDVFQCQVRDRFHFSLRHRGLVVQNGVELRARQRRTQVRQDVVCSRSVLHNHTTVERAAATP